jgi:hypothetical protein
MRKDVRNMGILYSVLSGRSFIEMGKEHDISPVVARNVFLSQVKRVSPGLYDEGASAPFSNNSGTPSLQWLRENKDRILSCAEEVANRSANKMVNASQERRSLQIGKQLCGTCRYYYAAEETKLGHIDDCPLSQEDYESQCRRYPPVRGDSKYHGEMSGSDVLSDCFSYPIVKTSWVCGEWRGHCRLGDE